MDGQKPKHVRCSQEDDFLQLIDVNGSRDLNSYTLVHSLFKLVPMHQQ